jgi:hypothetical protein
LSHLPTVWGVAGSAVALSGDHTIVDSLSKGLAAFAVEPPAAFELSVHGRLDNLPPYAFTSELSFEKNAIYYNAPVARAYADFDVGRGEVALDGAAHWTHVDYFLRVVLAVLLLKQRALLFHGAGVVDDGQAWVFFGPSGAGKTTAARASAPRQILHDDLLVLQPNQAGWQVHATPFLSSGGLRPDMPAHAPLRGLCHLVQDEQVRFQTLSSASALARLLACVPVVTQSPHLLDQVLELGHELAGGVPCCDLYFRPDPSFWEVLHGF